MHLLRVNREGDTIRIWRGHFKNL